MKIEDMTREEKSLLLFFETRAVDYSGRVSVAHMNNDDREIAEKWNTEGFVLYGRIASDFVNDRGANWCELSAEAWSIVHKLRQERGKQGFASRAYKTTEEKRAEG